MFRTVFSAAAVATTLPFMAIAEDLSNLDRSRRIIPLDVTITKGRWEDEKPLPGAAYYVGEKEIEKNIGGDVNRLVRQVPGVNVQEVDGFGLRPNIGMRGGRVDRSADITLMEDGVLIAPAPYAAPQAYYFPRTERMEGVEVRKGSSSIKYGPRTTNGAINFLSSSIPPVTGGKASISGGSYNSLRANTQVGANAGNFGAVLDAFHSQTDGFKNIDVVGGDSGFSIQDTMAKLRYKTDMTADFHQEFEFKFGATNEESDETYLGLTRADFNADPNRRYAASARDEMNARHNNFSFSHYMEPAANINITSTIYRTNFDRNWYRLNSVRTGGVTRDIGAVLNNSTANPAHLDILKGGNSAADGIIIRDNAREYYAKGAQTALNMRHNTGDIRHDMEIGLRIHSDEQDRFQREDLYQMTGGVLSLNARGADGSESNRISSADAIATYFQNRMEYGALAVTPGVRYEYIELTTEDYGKTDPTRSGNALQQFDSTITAVIPGVGVEYNLTPQWQVLGGVHKGFNPPEPPTSAANNVQEEESVNYEAGLRFKQNALKAEAIGFFTDYKNLLGSDNFSAGGGATGDQFNGGKVEVMGLEANLRYDFSTLIEKSAYRYPVKLTYTYTDATFQSSFNSGFAEWGNVRAGDELPYLPPHQFYVSAGVEQDDWAASISAKYNQKMRTVAGSGPLNETNSTDSNTVFDVNGEVEVSEGARVFGTVQNLFNEKYIAAARPAGFRPGAPQIVFVGLKTTF